MLVVKDKYRLELHWSWIEKPQESICVLRGGFFSGPAIKNAHKITAPNSIDIDLTPQYTKIISKYYFASLHWNDVEYRGDIVLLKDCTLISNFINDISNIDNTDYILIDTENHEEKVHNYNLVYRGALVNREGKEY